MMLRSPNSAKKPYKTTNEPHITTQVNMYILTRLLGICVYIHDNLKQAYARMTPCNMVLRSSMSAKEPYIIGKEPQV